MNSAIRLALALALSLPASAARAANDTVVTGIGSYGSFETAGVWITLSGDDNGNASAAVTIDGKEAHPLVRFDATHLATSLFGLRPATRYQVAVTVIDPDGVSGGTQVATVTTRPEPALPPALRDLYVAPAGASGASGDAAHPLSSIQEAVDRARPGDHVHVARGVYREEVVVTASGTADAPIAILGEEGAILDGSDPALASGGAAWSGAGPIYGAPVSFDSRYAALGEQRLYHATACPPPSPGHAPGDWCISGGTLYLRLADGSSPAGRPVNVARLTTGVAVEGAQHVWIQGLEIRYYGAGEYAKGVYLHGASDGVVRQNRVHNCGVPIWLKLGDRNVIDANAVWDTSVSGWTWDDVKAHDSEAAGIYVSDALGVGTVIRGNRVTGTFDGIDFCGDAVAAGNVTTETDVYDNVVDSHLDDGAEADGACTNARVFRNVFSDTHMGLSLAPAAPGPLFVVRNVFFRFGHLARDATSSAFKFNNGYGVTTRNVLVYHSTAFTDEPETPALWLGSPGAAEGVTFRNNILAGTAYAIEAADDNQLQLDLDHDDVYTSDPSRFVRWILGGVQHYASLAEFSAATGQEAHGVSALPTFVDLAGGDLRPAAGSPAIDAGVRIPGINDDFAGAAPDLGALEYGASPMLVPGDASTPGTPGASGGGAAAPASGGCSGSGAAGPIAWILVALAGCGRRRKAPSAAAGGQSPP